MEEKNPIVFISYSHDSKEHQDRVLNLSNKLRSEGIDCLLDQYEDSPPEGWPKWMDRNVKNSDFVLVVCTETYYSRVMGTDEKGLGIKWESSLIYQHLYNAGANNTRSPPSNSYNLATNIRSQEKNIENKKVPILSGLFYFINFLIRKIDRNFYFLPFALPQF
jgi:hypothetical protein